jgi:TPR repeat protein
VKNILSTADVDQNDFDQNIDVYVCGRETEITLRMYAFGQGVPQDFAEAVKWFRRSAEQAEAVAQFNLGLSYESGRGVDQDYAEAANWYRRAANQGYPAAQKALAYAYDKGLGVERDQTQAATWYRKAAELGDAEAQDALGDKYFYGDGITEDDSEAMKWYRRAADQGLSDAQFSVGNLFEHSESVPRDVKEAARWYQLAADKKEADAEFALGKLYRDGRGVPRNDVLAHKWFARAAENSDRSHQDHATSELHLLGLDTPISPDPLGKTFRMVWPSVGNGLVAWAVALGILGLWQFKFAKRATEPEHSAPSIFSSREFARRAELLFWAAFISLPFFTGGWQGYNWLKNESYRPEIHTLINSHEVCDDQHGCADKADVWKSKETAETYTTEDFAEHRHAEAVRMALTWFVYGAVGCFGFAYFRNLRDPGTLGKYLRRAFYVNAAIAVWTFIDIWH